MSSGLVLGGGGVLGAAWMVGALAALERVHAGGTDVTVLGPGPRDLEAIGSNLMDVQRRRHVLETSLQTSIAALEDPEPLPHQPGHDLEDDDERLPSDVAPSDVVPNDGIRDAG